MKEQHFCVTLYIFNETGSKTLLIKHKKLGWMLPVGGHIESNEDFLDAVSRETKEETGITEYTLFDFLHKTKFGVKQPHLIQRNTIKEGHVHDDLIYVAYVDENVKIKPGDGESTSIRWINSDDINNIDTSYEVRENVSELSKIIKANFLYKKTYSNIYAYPKYSSEVKESVADFLNGENFGDWNLGDIYTEVPNAFAKKMGANYGIFVNSGTSGLHASLIALGLQPGDEVIVPSMTFIRSVTPLNHLQLQPVIVDINKDTGNISPDAVKQAITPKTKAVVVVHMWGIPAECEALRKLCDEYKIKLIEDFSHAHFSKIGGKYVGSFGDVNFASLQRKKTLSVGEGGIITTNDSYIYEHLKHITSPGSFVDTSDYSKVDFSGFGLNLRMSPLSATIAKSILHESDEIISNRNNTIKKLAEIISEVTDKIELQKIPDAILFKDISWYSYKPKLIGMSIEDLQGFNLWRFGRFGYPLIADHPYWQKDSTLFPFIYGIKPRISGELTGTQEYLRDRISISIPLLEDEYWNDETIDAWKSDLKKVFV